MNGRSTTSWQYPPDAEDHYKELLIQTQNYRLLPMHEAAGYHGPWIENHFIAHFITKPLSYFNGLIPLFVQWVDLHCFDMDFNPETMKRNATTPDYKTYHTQIAKLLREDVLYVTVSQDDQGIHKLTELRPNILVLSAGGYGHIPIPLLKEMIHYIPPKLNIPSNNSSKSAPGFDFEWDVAFYGNIRPRLSRSHMLAEIKNILERRRIKYRFHQGHDWKAAIGGTKFNLVPRGYGRTSYRLSEVILIGRIPVYLYDDEPWLPYRGSNISVDAFGLVGKMGTLDDLVSKIVAIGSNETEVALRMAMIREAKGHYTYEGLLQQIERFMQDPLGPNGGDLRCEKVPDKDKRRLL